MGVVAVAEAGAWVTSGRATVWARSEPEKSVGMTRSMIELFLPFLGQKQFSGTKLSLLNGIQR
jgi:hypothetical protein